MASVMSSDGLAKHSRLPPAYYILDIEASKEKVTTSTSSCFLSISSKRATSSLTLQQPIVSWFRFQPPMYSARGIWLRQFKSQDRFTWRDHPIRIRVLGMYQSAYGVKLLVGGEEALLYFS